MSDEEEILAYFNTIRSKSKSNRDLAVDYLGDFLEHENCERQLLQNIINELGGLLLAEQDSDVIESILNALSFSVHSKYHLQLPSDAIKDTYQNQNQNQKFKDSSIEHAKYILENT